DSYMYACNYLKGRKAPRAIVIGVSPREFYDSAFKSAENTVNFTYQGWNIAGKHIARFYFRSWEQYADFMLRKLSFLYGQRSVMQQFLAARCRPCTVRPGAPALRPRLHYASTNNTTLELVPEG